MNWKNNVNQLFKEIDKRNKKKGNSNDDKEMENISVDEFLVRIVKPAFTKLKEELSKYGRESRIENQDFFSAIIVKFNNEEEFYYEVKVREANIANGTIFNITTYDITDNKSDNGGEELTSYPQHALGLISEKHIIYDFIRGYQQKLLNQ